MKELSESRITKSDRKRESARVRQLRIHVWSVEDMDWVIVDDSSMRNTNNEKSMFRVPSLASLISLPGAGGKLTSPD